MRVPADDRSYTGGNRVKIERVPIMKHIDMPARKFDHLRFREPPATPISIHVPPDRGNWSNMPEPVENSRVAHISSMKDVSDMAQRRDRLWPQQAMGIGNHTYQHPQIPMVSRVRGSR